MAHEIGHTLGLWHDFVPWHLPYGCDGEGPMSYTGKEYGPAWSECSKRDFEGYYNYVKEREEGNKMKWCMGIDQSMYICSQHIPPACKLQIQCKILILPSVSPKLSRLLVLLQQPTVRVQRRNIPHMKATFLTRR